MCLVSGAGGGNAVADILIGNVNPSGKMPISVPKNVGQIPVYYNKKNPDSHDYVELDALPAYAFGYGLSYTTFEYKNLEIKKIENEGFIISFNLKNTGRLEGKEVVQLYVRDEIASVVQANKQLRQFQKIALKPNESRKITFAITEDDLWLINKDLKKVVEPGDFKIMIGSSSDRIHLGGKITVN